MNGMAAREVGASIGSPLATPKRKREVEMVSGAAGSFFHSVPSQNFSFKVPSPVPFSESNVHQDNWQRAATCDPANPSLPSSLPRSISPRGTQFTEKFQNLSIHRGNGDLNSIQSDLPSSQLSGSIEEYFPMQVDDPYRSNLPVPKRLKVRTDFIPCGTVSDSDATPDPDIFEALRHENLSQRSKLEGIMSNSRSPKKRRGGTQEEPTAIVDPVRASLTWKEEEITIYDPNDADDDGIGVNGLGFKPSATIAHSRQAKRRQQVAEYRKREENEARSRRNERRRGAANNIISPKSQTPRKVRFVEPDDSPMAAS